MPRWHQMKIFDIPTLSVQDLIRLKFLDIDINRNGTQAGNILDRR